MVNDRDRKDDWSNTHNSEYYEQVPAEVFGKYAKIGGFDNGCDIDLCFPYIETCASLLEVGAGYGRVIHHLLRRNYQGRITAIERSANFYEHLVKHYRKYATLIHADIESLTPKPCYEALTWMWSNISEWRKEKQQLVVNRLRQWLVKDGVFVLEIIDATQKPINSSNYNDQSYVTHTSYGTVYGYNASQKEILAYAKAAKLSVDKIIPYDTSTQRKRVIFILRAI